MEPIYKLFHEPKYQNTLYLDKDGVLNTAFYRSGKLSSPRNIEEVKIKKDLEDILIFSKKKNFNLTIISNQPDIERKLITESFLDKNIEMIREHLPISVAMICPHLGSSNCSCRKPRIGLILKYRKLFPNNHKKELFIGDQLSDRICAESLEIPFLKVQNSLSLYNKINGILAW